MRPEEAERENRIQQDQVDLVLLDRGAHGGQRVGRREEEDLAGHALDADAPLGLRGVEGGGPVVRRRSQDHEGGRVEPAPQVPEVVLNATDLGGEVVRDEEVSFHRAPPAWSCGRRGGRWGSAGLRAETQCRDQPGALEHAHGTRLVGVDDDGVVGLALEEEADDAVVAGRGVP